MGDTIDPPVRIGVVGCGNISGVYLRNLRATPGISVVSCADIDLDRARQRAEANGVPRACSPEELLADPEVELVLNLTIPAAHMEVSVAALEAGKHLYSEKPLATARHDGARILRLAQERGLRVGCAPDTFLGGALQTVRRLLDEGAVGDVVGANAACLYGGPESWHPNPDFFYQPGAGPLFDMGPYYLTALISLLGPITRATGSARITRERRSITSQPLAGTDIVVRTPTHIAAVFDFATGAVGNLTISFDVTAHSLPHIEIYGTSGVIRCADPNFFEGSVSLWQPAPHRWEPIEFPYDAGEDWRGVGVADMAAALRSGREPRAQGRMAYHVLDVMHSVLEASQTERHVRVESSCERPDPLPQAPTQYGMLPKRPLRAGASA